MVLEILRLLALLAWTGPLVIWEAKRPIGHWDGLGVWPAEWGHGSPEA